MRAAVVNRSERHGSKKQEWTELLMVANFLEVLNITGFGQCESGASSLTPHVGGAAESSFRTIDTMSFEFQRDLLAGACLLGLQYCTVICFSDMCLASSMLYMDPNRWVSKVARTVADTLNGVTGGLLLPTSLLASEKLQNALLARQQLLEESGAAQPSSAEKEEELLDEEGAVTSEVMANLVKGEEIEKIFDFARLRSSLGALADLPQVAQQIEALESSIRTISAADPLTPVEDVEHVIAKVLHIIRLAAPHRPQ